MLIGIWAPEVSMFAGAAEKRVMEGDSAKVIASLAVIKAIAQRH
jgi:hypothetical protein